MPPSLVSKSGNWSVDDSLRNSADFLNSASTFTTSTVCPVSLATTLGIDV